MTKIEKVLRELSRLYSFDMRLQKALGKKLIDKALHIARSPHPTAKIEPESNTRQGQP